MQNVLFELLEFLREERRKKPTRPCEESAANGVMKTERAYNTKQQRKQNFLLRFSFSLFLFNNIENISERKGQRPY